LATILCVPVLKALLLQVAVRVLPTPLSATVPQPVSVLPPSVKLTLPLGAFPLTLALNVTLAPTEAGLSELVSSVVLGVRPPASTPQASISTMVGTLSSDRVTLTRIRGVVYGAKETVRLTRLLPTTLPSVTQVEPSQGWTVKSVMPYTLKVRLSVGSTGAP